MPNSIRYCRGCNEQFAAPDDDPRCPVCRQTLTVFDVSPTLDFDATVLCAPPERALESLDLAQTLIGRSFDTYAIESFLGKGGMAWVFLARHQALQRPCAIKILRPDLRSRMDRFLDLFMAEARAAASVVHPHIVAVHNVGEVDAYHYIELEYVAGQSLQQLAQETLRLSPLRATYLLRQACSALAAAHRRGLVHRDFKPGNVLVGENDYAKLADFGLAKRIASSPASGAEGTLVGTPYYMAPELFTGQPATPASDVYAVGVSYYLILTGQFPFVDRDLTVLIDKHAKAPIPDPRELVPDVPEPVVNLVRRCLAKDPRERPANGEQLHEELRALFLQLRDLPTLVQEACRASDWECREEGSRTVVTVPLGNGRRQRVMIEERTDGPSPEAIVRIFSVCGPADDRHCRPALELNARIAHGSLAIETVDGEPHFVMLNCYPRCTCDAEEIRRSVQQISQWADYVERALGTQDAH